MKKSYLLFAIVVIASMVLRLALPRPRHLLLSLPWLQLSNPPNAPEPTLIPRWSPLQLLEPVTASLRIWADEQRAPVLKNELAAKFWKPIIWNSWSRTSPPSAIPLSLQPPLAKAPILSSWLTTKAAQLVASGLVAPTGSWRKGQRFL